MNDNVKPEQANDHTQFQSQFTEDMKRAMNFFQENGLEFADLMMPNMRGQYRLTVLSNQTGKSSQVYSLNNVGMTMAIVWNLVIAERKLAKQQAKENENALQTALESA